MLIHNVFFLLKTNLDEEALASFEQGLDALVHDSAAKGGHYGKPAATPVREVIESSYTYGLILVFEDMAGHDRYQVGDVHKEFLAAHAAKWDRVRVYDVETSSP
jgi:hypothetical protein